MKRLAAVLLVMAACKSGDKGAGDKAGATSKGGGNGCETKAAKPSELVAGTRAWAIASIPSAPPDTV